MFQGIFLMLSPCTPRRQARSLRFRPAPWHDRHRTFLYLDSRIPRDHFVRRIDQLLRLFDFQPLLHDFYAGFGSSSYHPRVYLGIMLYELNAKVISPARWHTDCTDVLPLRWLLRGACPSRDSLYRCRDRFNPDLLLRLNQQLLQLAQQEQLCPAQLGSLDGTFVAARASRHQLLNLRRLDKRLGLLQEVLDAHLRQVEWATPLPCWMAKTHKGQLRQHTRHQEARRALLKKIEWHRQRQSSRAKKKRQPDNRVVVSVSEPEAAIGKDKMKVVRPLYNVQILRDTASEFILGYGVFATNTDAGLLPAMLERTRQLSGALPGELLADGIYASVRDLQVCKQEHVVLYAPVEDVQAAEPPPPSNRRVSLAVLPDGQAATASVSEQGNQVQQPSYYGKEKFTWQEQTRSYTCPAGKQLQCVSKGKSKRGEDDWVEVEHYGTKECRSCEQRQACTRSKSGRRIKRMVDEPLVEEMRQRMRTEQGKEKYKRRKETIEKVFGDWKEHRGLRQFSSFGIKRAETTIALLVLLHNGKALLKARASQGARIVA
jgi:transposase